METIEESLKRLLEYLNMFKKPGEEVIADVIKEILNILNNFDHRIKKLEKDEGWDTRDG